ncbi:MAG TPA: hypothetical protein VNF99_04560 [Stellaceae bacterium]|nr:hypothetical protein [Stellaceae bacterium]
MRAGLAGLDRATLALCLSLVGTRVIALGCFAVFDDAFITFRYARNLAAGHGFVYNAGDWVLGTTAPLFGLLSSLVFVLGGAPESVLPWCNIGLDLAIALLVRQMMFRGDRFGFALFVACFALSPMLARVTVGAMEVNLFVLLGLGAFALYQSQRPYLAAALGALAYFLRPEAVLIVAVLCLAEMFVGRRPWRAVGMGALALAVVAPGLVAMELIYGHFIPQSVIAKSARVAVPPWDVIRQLLAPEPISAAIAAVGAIGVGLALRAGGIARLLAVWLLLYLCAYALGGPKIWSWYGFMPLCLSAIFAARALAAGLVRVPRARFFCRGARVEWTIAAGVVACWAALGIWRFPDRITQNVYDPVASFCRDHETASATILASDIGVIGYRCPGFIEDAAALVWPPAQDYNSIWAIAAATKPTYLFLNVGKTMLTRMSAAPLASAYRPLRRFDVDGIADPRRIRNRSDDWAQEYIVYRRVDAPPPAAKTGGK